MPTKFLRLTCPVNVRRHAGLAPSPLSPHHSVDAGSLSASAPGDGDIAESIPRLTSQSFSVLSVEAEAIKSPLSHRT